ncbi:hypothetical protein RSOLAG1IB_11839 [Rhizoctonia solani AG-1 IB]|uniref:Uncharacterized protein n=1 Tax=Thanatephorus cucumeris (strain AG1-IB / isolate 7/3/14) TaxID=1108050 RepID=A0A0B7FFR3_THACB|nr:hypothetical protein RSOLAG1IB_11839 [Rhizoctonia solani AG-1 IB]
METRPASLPSRPGVPVSIPGSLTPPPPAAPTPPISLPSQSYTFLILMLVLRIHTYTPSPSARKSLGPYRLSITRT